ncbi:MAG: hypothetical protein U5J95_12385 [Balneolaceae bacterium]|nr:hypothetical protein [Balneolaceae bacterium]
MDRRQFLISSSLAATATLLPLKKLFAFKDEGTFTSLRRNVGYFTDRGGTIGWLASDDALVVIDSQYPQTAKGCLQGLKQKTSHEMDLLIKALTIMVIIPAATRFLMALQKKWLHMRMCQC